MNLNPNPNLYWLTAVQFSGRVLGSGIAFLTTIFLARSLGIEQFGEFTKITSFVLVFMAIADFGLNQVFLKQHATNYIKSFYWFLGLRFTFSLVLAIIASALIWFFARLQIGISPLVQSGVMFMSLSVVGYGIFLSCSAVLQREQRFLTISFIQLCGSLAGFILILGSYLFGQSGIGVGVAAYVLNWFVAGMISLIALGSIDGKIQWWDKENSLRLMMSAGPVGAALLMNALMFRADVFLLSRFSSNTEVGAYGLAYRCFELLISLPTFFMMSLYPELLSRKETVLVWRRELGAIFQKTAIIWLPVTILSLIGAPMLEWIRPEYQNAVIILRLLTLGLPIFFVTSPTMWFAILADKQKKLLLIYAGGLGFNLLANWLFIPIFRAGAAAVNTGLTELVVLILGWWLLFKKNNI